MTTWNPADKSASIILSNGNLTYTGDSSAAGGVRSSLSKNAGKWYFEFNNINADDAFGQTAAGLATATAVLADFVNGGGGNDYFMRFGGLDGATLAAFAVDLDNGLIWFQRDSDGWIGNDDDPGDPATGTNGIPITDFIPGWVTATTEIFIAACAGGDQSDTDGMTLVPTGDTDVPAGFAPWDDDGSAVSDALASDKADADAFSSDHREEVSSDDAVSDALASEQHSSEVQSDLQGLPAPPIQCVVTVAS